jgi:hypothetical protein
VVFSFLGTLITLRVENVVVDAWVDVDVDVWDRVHVHVDVDASTTGIFPQ